MCAFTPDIPDQSDARERARKHQLQIESEEERRRRAAATGTSSLIIPRGNSNNSDTGLKGNSGITGLKV